MVDNDDEKEDVDAHFVKIEFVSIVCLYIILDVNLSKMAEIKRVENHCCWFFLML